MPQGRGGAYPEAVNAGAGGDATTRVRRADHANALGRHDEALRLASQVLAGDPTHHGASVAAGIALLSTGRVAQGIEMLRAAVAAHPDSAEVLRLLSCGYVRSGQSTWALRSARAAVALEPWEPMARCRSPKHWSPPATGWRRSTRVNEPWSWPPRQTAKPI